MNATQISEALLLNHDYCDSLITGFWVNMLHRSDGSWRVISIDENDDSDLEIFEAQAAVALGFTDAPEVL